MREGTPIGVINLWRSQVQPFTDKQIELVTTFADQAVIAIENVRLFEAEQQRTHELSESLEQQTATSEVLQVISRSPGELRPVFETMLEKATRICDSKLGALFLREADLVRLVAMHGVEPALREKLQGRLLRPAPNIVLGRLARGKEKVHIADALAEQGFFETPAGFDGPLLALEAGARTLLGVPMLKDNEFVGGILIYRQEVRPFNDKQIALITSFARQAVIAIENTRLLKELREALEQQTATSEVLRVISSSPGDLEPVFASMLENAVRICDAKFGNIYNRAGGEFYLAATHNTPPAFADYRKRSPIMADMTVPGRMLGTKAVVHVADLASEQAYANRTPGTVAAVELGGVRTFLAVPMLKENELIGALALSRQEVRPFTDKQIELVTSFAAQAVIALTSLGVVEIEKSTGHAERLITRSMDRAGRG